MACQFVPGYLLERLGRADDEGMRARRGQRHTLAPTTAGAAWEIHDAESGSTLPGRLVRSAGDPEVVDPAVNEAAIGIIETLALYTDLGRSSYDGNGATVLASVHYEQDYDNAFWEGSQLVLGDGDGTVFGRFTTPIDVLGHELSHALTEFTANLTYQGQSGALNESVSDVLGACIKQRHLGQDAAAADWLVGEGIFLDGVNGTALRSMGSPGTAYDDPHLGKDPQVGSMADYVEMTEDNGGVHVNSGIPNRAFVLAARAIGGASWSGAGRIWYAALTSGIAADTDFAGFAAATVAAAGEHATAVSEAWTAVGVTPGASSRVASAAPTVRAVEVVRTGGFAGLRRHGTVDLHSEDPRAPRAAELVRRIDFAADAHDLPQPDRFSYCFRHDGAECVVPEQALTTDQRALADLLLGD